MPTAASLVVGTHTHVPTADHQILPADAFQTDAGMCGDYDSVIGMDKQAATARFTGEIGPRLSVAVGEPTLCGFVEANDEGHATGGTASPRRAPVRDEPRLTFIIDSMQPAVNLLASLSVRMDTHLAATEIQEPWQATVNSRISSIARAPRTRAREDLRSPDQGTDRGRARRHRPVANPRLRTALAAGARQHAADNIDRVIKKAEGGEGEIYDEIATRATAPAARLDRRGDDRQQEPTASRCAAFSKFGGSLARPIGRFMLDRLDRFAAADVTDADSMFEAALEAGADNVESDDDGHEITCATEDYNSVVEALEASFGAPAESGLVWKPQNTIEVNEDQAER